MLSLNEDGESVDITLNDVMTGLTMKAKGTWNVDNSTLYVPVQEVADMEGYLIKMQGVELTMIEDEWGIDYDYKLEEGPLAFVYDDLSATFTCKSKIALWADFDGEPLFLTVFESFKLQGESLWTNLGVGKYKDNLVAAVYEMTADDVPEVEVNVYEKTNSPGIYKVQDAWKEFYWGDGDLEIDLTDPDFGFIYDLNTGVVYDESKGSIWLFGTTYYYFENGYDKESWIAQYGTENYIISLDKATNRIILRNGAACFWYPESGDNQAWLRGSFHGYVQLPTQSAIDNVAVDAADENAPVEYYNLQGVKLANPEAGQVVIRRQGSKVSKIFVK